MNRTLSTKEKALIEGRSLLQKHGYNGFSFKDIASKLKIKPPSLYDHYPNKEELIVAIIDEYATQFDDWGKKVETLSPFSKIERAFHIFHHFASDQSKVCPILALAADFSELPRGIQSEMQVFVERWLTWLSLQILEGQNARQIRTDMTARDLANFIYSQGMGSQIQARICKKPKLTLSSGSAIVNLIKC